MRKLFVSFTSLLPLVSSQQVSPTDLATGLYFLGCWREHALNPGGAGEFNPLLAKPAYPAAHQLIKAGILQADAEGRAEWHNAPKRTGSPWRRLNDLLKRNGLPLLTNIPEGDPWVSYGYPAVRDAVQAAGLPLEVVY